MSKLYKVAYDQRYIGEAEQADAIDIVFTKNEECNTYMNITTHIGDDTYKKEILIITESELDDFDLEGINEILADNHIKLKRIES
ncbi:hypothetical protein [Staphylococcus gallinarum]|uniref:hypothetical protein n=1 Tax=Staphylococcus gallinarum TaxID=1293 RepID=UPI0030BD7164